MGLFTLLFGSKSVFSRHYVSSDTEAKIKRDWETITVLLKQKSPSQLKEALITADKTLDAALKDIAKGETMGERLKDAKTKFEKDMYNKIWEAHKIRNNMVHEAGYEPPYYMVEQAVSNIKKGLQELKVKL